MLVQYVGWGGLKQVFSTREEHKGWEDERAEVRKLLTDEEYENARASVLNSHYTSTEIISAMWEAVRALGFKGGRVYEPSIGIGHFFGLIPDELRGSVQLAGIDLDSISARIARQLYQLADIRHTGFQDASVPENSVDLCISNVPFGNIPVTDSGSPALTKLRASIHNFFFAKAIDRVRPGGLVVFVTSRYTMDSADSKIRRWMAERARLVGMVRLPKTAFEGIANTEVVTDIVILQKLAPGQKGDGSEWIASERMHDIELPEGVEAPRINRWYHAHPEAILGKPAMSGAMRAKNEFTVEPSEGDLGAAVVKVMATFSDRIDRQALDLTSDAALEAAARKIGGEAEGMQESSTQIRDGKVWIVENGVLVEHPDFPNDPKVYLSGPSRETTAEPVTIPCGWLVYLSGPSRETTAVGGKLRGITPKLHVCLADFSAIFSHGLQFSYGQETNR